MDRILQEEVNEAKEALLDSDYDFDQPQPKRSSQRDRSHCLHLAILYTFIAILILCLLWTLLDPRDVSLVVYCKSTSHDLVHDPVLTSQHLPIP